MTWTVYSQSDDYKQNDAEVAANIKVIRQKTDIVVLLDIDNVCLIWYWLADGPTDLIVYVRNPE